MRERTRIRRERNMKLFVTCVLALAVLLASPAVSLARVSRMTPGKKYCLCTCRAKGYGIRALAWEDKYGACVKANGGDCNLKEGKKTHSGKLEGCESCKANENGYPENCTAGAPVKPIVKPIPKGGLTPLEPAR